MAIDAALEAGMTVEEYKEQEGISEVLLFNVLILSISTIKFTIKRFKCVEYGIFNIWMFVEIAIALTLSLVVERDVNSTISGYFFSVGTSIWILIRPLTFRHCKFAMIKMTMKEYEARVHACNDIDICKYEVTKYGFE